MSSSRCLDCNRQTLRARCQDCHAEHAAPDHSGETYDCPECSGRTSGRGVTCATCRTTGGDH